MLLSEMDSNPLFLCFYCKTCSKRVECDSMEQNVFVNPVYRDCAAREYVVRKSSYYDSLGSLFFPLPDDVKPLDYRSSSPDDECSPEDYCFSVPILCSNCGSSVDVTKVLGVWVCSRCLSSV